MPLPRYRVLQILFQRVAERHDGAVFLADEIARWPAGIGTALKGARLIEQGQPAEGLICTGCPERCYRQADIIEEAGTCFAMSTCELFASRGPFRNPISCLGRWIATRSMVARFAAGEMGWKLPPSEGVDTRFRFGTQRFGDARRAVMLEFAGTTQLHIGGLHVELSEVSGWRGESPFLDRDALEALAHAAPDLQSGGKREQPSSAVQTENKTLTTIRNNRWQRKAERLHAKHPKWSQCRVAQEIGRTPEFANISPATIERVIRLPKK